MEWFAFVSQRFPLIDKLILGSKLKETEGKRHRMLLKLKGFRGCSPGSLHSNSCWEETELPAGCAGAAEPKLLCVTPKNLTV